MAQTPVLMHSEDCAIDYTPGSAVTAGDVIVVGTRPLVATSDIAAGDLGSLATEGIFKVPKTSDSFTAGDYVYWDADGNPVTGTAGSGAADSSSATGNVMGFAVANAASGDSYVKTCLLAKSVGQVDTVTSVAAASVAATGSDQSDAAAMVAGFTFASAADGTKGVKLPAAAAGTLCIVKNADAANAILKVYPATGDAINALSANAAISMAAKTAAVFVALDSTTWYTVPLLPS